MADATHPRQRRTSRFQVEPGLGIPRSLKERASEKYETPRA